MSWEQRLRDMVLAGGAGTLAAVACVDGSGAGGDSGSHGNVVPDVTPGANDDSGADGNVGPGDNFCCNANPDPCCPQQYCGAPVTADCAEQIGCEADGGTWDYSTARCAPPGDSGTSDAPSDAITNSDSGSGDALFDAVDVFCCNANPDPCCQSRYCGATVTVKCTEKMACEADGGTWNLTGVCALDAGTRDATSDAP